MGKKISFDKRERKILRKLEFERDEMVVKVEKKMMLKILSSSSS